VIDSEPPALGVRVGLDARDQLRGAALRGRPALGIEPPRHPGGRIGQEPVGHHPHACANQCTLGLRLAEPKPYAPTPAATERGATPQPQQRATAATGGSEHGAAAPARIEPGWWSPTWLVGGNISARDGSTRSWEECAAAAAMNRGLVGVERGGGRAGLGRVRVGVWFGPY